MSGLPAGTVYVRSTPGSDAAEEETQLAEETQGMFLPSSPKSLMPVGQILEREAAVQLALGPQSQLDPPAPSHALPSSISGSPDLPLQTQSSPRQAQSYPVNDSTGTQGTDDSEVRKPSAMLFASNAGRPTEVEQSLNSTASDSQAFKYDHSVEEPSYVPTVDSQNESMEATQVGTQYPSQLPTQIEQDEPLDPDHSSAPSNGHVHIQPSNGDDRASDSKAEDPSAREDAPRREVTFSASTHAFDAAKTDRLPSAVTPLGKRLSKVLVAETPDNVPAASVHARSSPGSSAHQSDLPEPRMSELAVAPTSRPSSPLSSVPPSSNPGKGLGARGSHSSVDSGSTARREPPAIAHVQPQPAIASPAPLSPTQHDISPARASGPSTNIAASRGPSLTDRSPSPFADPVARVRSRRPREDAHRSSSQVPETQPALTRAGSSGSVATLPGTPSNHDGMEDDQASQFGQDSDLEDSGERERKRFMSRNPYSSREVDEPRWVASNSNEQEDTVEVEHKAEPEHATMDEEDDELAEDYSMVMDNDNQPTSSLYSKLPSYRHQPRSSSQSPDPLLMPFIHSTQQPSLQTHSAPGAFPFPSSPHSTNAEAGPSRVLSKEMQNLQRRQVSLPAPPREPSPPQETLDPSSLIDNVEVIISPHESLMEMDDAPAANETGASSKGKEVDRTHLADLDHDDGDGMARVPSFERLSTTPSDPSVGVSRKRSAEDVDRDERSDGEGVAPTPPAEKAPVKSAKKAKKGKRDEGSATDRSAGPSTKVAPKGKQSGGRGKKRAGRGSVSAGKTSSAASKKKKTNVSRSHLARTPAKVQARGDAFTQGHGLSDSESSGESIEDADDSTWQANGASSKKKRKVRSEPTQSEEDVDEQSDVEMSDHEARPATPEADQEDGSLAPPLKPSPRKKTPYGRRTSKKLASPPKRPALINSTSSNNSNNRERSKSISYLDSPAAPTSANAVAGPSRLGLAAPFAAPHVHWSNRVFAPWKNKKNIDYYAATVSDLEPDGLHCAIAFDDNDSDRKPVSKLRRCVLNPGDEFVADKVHWIVAPGHGTGKVLEKGDVVKAHRKDQSTKKLMDVPVLGISIPTSLVKQLADRTVDPSDIVSRPTTAKGTRATPAASDTDSASVAVVTPSTRAKGKARAVTGVLYPQGGSHFQNMGFVLSSVAKDGQIKKKLLTNGGTVAEDLNAFFSVRGVRAEGKMADRTYTSDDFTLNESFSGLTNIIVISDEAGRTTKMLKALALGMPRVASAWVDRAKPDNTSWRAWVLSKPRSIMTPQSLSQYVHPGWGEDPQLLSSPLSPAHSICGRRRPLDGDAVFCCIPATSPVERELLVFCCLAMGAISVTLQPDLTSLDPDKDQADLYILPDHTDVPERLRIKFQTYKVVDVEWVKQTIIFGEKLVMDLVKPLVDELGDTGAGNAAGKGAKAAATGGTKKKQRG